MKEKEKFKVTYISTHRNAIERTERAIGVYRDATIINILHPISNWTCEFGFSYLTIASLNRQTVCGLFTPQIPLHKYMAPAVRILTSKPNQYLCVLTQHKK